MSACVGGRYFLYNYDYTNVCPQVTCGCSKKGSRGSIISCDVTCGCESCKVIMGYIEVQCKV